MSSSLQPPPGWYPDPGNPSRQRYYDGMQWTEHVSAPAVAPSRPRNSWVTWLVAGAVGVVLLMFGGCAAAIVGWTAARQSSSDLAVESVVSKVNSGLGLPDGAYVVPQALAAATEQKSVACVFAGTAVPASNPLSQTSWQVTLAAPEKFCSGVSPDSIASMEMFSVQFTVNGGVAAVTKVTPSSR